MSQSVSLILSGLMTTISTTNKDDDKFSASQLQLFFSNILNHVIAIITELNANAKIIRDNYPYDDRKDDENKVAVVTLNTAYKNIEMAFKSFNPPQNLLQNPAIANLKATYTFICFYLKILALYKLVVILFSMLFHLTFLLHAFYCILYLTVIYRLRNWVDLLQTANLVIKDLFSKSQPVSSHNQQKGQQKRFLPIGSTELLLLTSHAHKALGHINESIRCLKLAIVSAELKYKEYELHASDTNKLSNTHDVSNCWYLADHIIFREKLEIKYFCPSNECDM